ncbi:DNA cytosine methyltransferase [Mycoplasma sp. 3686d]|uniref:DNA cytosine methyltransferase n=1 Tax=Mycoplasma sp. 3686d TaxID=2967300 RepID=UPI00211D1102|nr:DNA cytosine methyltransferase [Mycoplasma sp. 3686d]UUM24574.1 DNA cytosine methyltransferase [Mycoplasma sp. 3686d]
MKTLKIFEAFAGIGSQIKALNMVGQKNDFKVQSLGSIEWGINQIVSYQIMNFGLLDSENDYSKEQMIDKLSQYTFSSDNKNPIRENYFAKIGEQKLRKLFPYLYSFVNKSYFEQKYKQKAPFNHTNIKTFKELPKNIDIFTYSFPCVGFSIAGKQKGFNDPQSELLYEVKRILETNLDRLPKILILENVVQLAGVHHKEDFQKWIDFLSSLGYHTTWKLINSADLGSPQNRKRLFAVSILNSVSQTPFKFINVKEKDTFLEDILDPNYNKQDYTHLLEQYQISEFKTSQNNITSASLLNFSTYRTNSQIFLAQGRGPTLTAQGSNSDLKFYFPEQKKLRIISPKEAFLYMGFSNKDFELVSQTNLISDTKLKFIAGNSICIQVLYSIFSNIFTYLTENYWPKLKTKLEFYQRQKMTLEELIVLERNKYIANQRLHFYKETIKRFCQLYQIYSPNEWIKLIDKDFKEYGVKSKYLLASRAISTPRFFQTPFHKIGKSGLFIPIQLNKIYKVLTKWYFSDLTTQFNY